VNLARTGRWSEQCIINLKAEGDQMTEIIKRLDIMGDQVTSWQDHRTGKVYIECRGRCEFLGVAWGAQQQKLQNSKFFGRHLLRIDIDTEAGIREVLGLEVKYARIWLAGISVERIKPEIHEHFMDYLEHMADVLDRHWQQKTPRLVDHLLEEIQKRESDDYNAYIMDIGGNHKKLNAQICRDLSDLGLNPIEYVDLVKEELKERGQRYGQVKSGQDALRVKEKHSAAACSFQKHYVVRGHAYNMSGEVVGINKVLPVSKHAKGTFKLMEMANLPIGELEEGGL
jgi:hypothetical protein